MRYINLLCIVILLSSNPIFSQIKYEKTLDSLLTKDQSFQEVKSTLLNYYGQKIKNSRDSLLQKDAMRQLKFWNRYLWLNEYYVGDNGMVKNHKDVDVSGFQDVKRNFKSSLRSQNGAWWQDGPTSCFNGLGRIDEIAFHPFNNNIIFAGSPHGGLFKSQDGGDSWISIGTYLPSLGVSGIAIHATNPDIIYVLSGDGDSNGGCFAGGYCLRRGELVSNSDGVYKSTDGGVTWSRTGVLSTNQFVGHELVIDPQNPEVLWAATSDGLYRTGNGGTTWQALIGGNVWDVKIKPSNSNVVYACDANSVFIFKPNNGVMAYAGATFVANSNRLSLATTPDNVERLYVLAGRILSNTTFTGIYTSTNEAGTFSLITQTPNVFSNTIGGAVFADQSDYDNCIAVSPTDENEIYVGGLCVWKSADGGQNWAQVSAYWPANTPYMHPDIHELAYNGSALYCGNDGGFYRLNGSLWEMKSNNLTTTQFYHFELGNSSITDRGGCQDNGIIKRSMQGNNAYENIQFGDGFDVMADHPWSVTDGESDDAYTTVNTGILRNGTNISVPGNVNFFGNLAMHPNDENKIYVGYQQGVFFSADKGANWSNLGASGNWALATCKSVPDKFYTAGNGNMWRRNVDNTWTDITPPSPYNGAFKIADIEVDPNDDNNIAICIGSANSNAKVFVSFNSGNNWNNITYNLPNVPIFCITQDASGGYYVGTSIGVFYKRVFSGVWEFFSNELPPVPVTEIEIEKIFIGGIWIEGAFVNCSTFGRGMWKSAKYSPSCDPIITLTQAQRGRRNFQASDQITSSSNNYGGVGTDIKYSATNKILLQNGFRASNGIKFKTYLQGCNGL